MICLVRESTHIRRTSAVLSEIMRAWRLIMEMYVGWEKKSCSTARMTDYLHNISNCFFLKYLRRRSFFFSFNIFKYVESRQGSVSTVLELREREMKMLFL